MSFAARLMTWRVRPNLDELRQEIEASEKRQRLRGCHVEDLKAAEKDINAAVMSETSGER